MADSIRNEEAIERYNDLYESNDSEHDARKEDEYAEDVMIDKIVSEANLEQDSNREFTFSDNNIIVDDIKEQITVRRSEINDEDVDNSEYLSIDKASIGTTAANESEKLLSINSEYTAKEHDDKQNRLGNLLDRSENAANDSKSDNNTIESQSGFDSMTDHSNQDHQLSAEIVSLNDSYVDGIDTGSDQQLASSISQKINDVNYECDFESFVSSTNSLCMTRTQECVTVDSSENNRLESALNVSKPIERSLSNRKSRNQQRDEHKDETIDSQENTANLPSEAHKEQEYGFICNARDTEASIENDQEIDEKSKRCSFLRKEDTTQRQIVEEQIKLVPNDDSCLLDKCVSFSKMADNEQLTVHNQDSSAISMIKSPISSAQVEDITVNDQPLQVKVHDNLNHSSKDENNLLDDRINSNTSPSGDTQKFETEILCDLRISNSFAGDQCQKEMNVNDDIVKGEFFIEDFQSQDENLVDFNKEMPIFTATGDNEETNLNMMSDLRMLQDPLTNNEQINDEINNKSSIEKACDYSNPLNEKSNNVIEYKTGSVALLLHDNGFQERESQKRSLDEWSSFNENISNNDVGGPNDTDSIKVPFNKRKHSSTTIYNHDSDSNTSITSGHITPSNFLSRTKSGEDGRVSTNSEIVRNREDVEHIRIQESLFSDEHHENHDMVWPTRSTTEDSKSNMDAGEIEKQTHSHNVLREGTEEEDSERTYTEKSIDRYVHNEKLDSLAVNMNDYDHESSCVSGNERKLMTDVQQMEEAPSSKTQQTSTETKMIDDKEKSTISMLSNDVKLPIVTNCASVHGQKSPLSSSTEKLFTNEQIIEDSKFTMNTQEKSQKIILDDDTVDHGRQYSSKFKDTIELSTTDRHNSTITNDTPSTIENPESLNIERKESQSFVTSLQNRTLLDDVSIVNEKTYKRNVNINQTKKENTSRIGPHTAVNLTKKEHMRALPSEKFWQRNHRKVGAIIASDDSINNKPKNQRQKRCLFWMKLCIPCMIIFLLLIVVTLAIALTIGVDRSSQNKNETTILITATQTNTTVLLMNISLMSTIVSTTPVVGSNTNLPVSTNPIGSSILLLDTTTEPELVTASAIITSEISTVSQQETTKYAANSISNDITSPTQTILASSEFSSIILPMETSSSMNIVTSEALTSTITKETLITRGSSNSFSSIHISSESISTVRSTSVNEETAESSTSNLIFATVSTDFTDDTTGSLSRTEQDTATASVSMTIGASHFSASLTQQASSTTTMDSSVRSSSPEYLTDSLKTLIPSIESTVETSTNALIASSNTDTTETLRTSHLTTSSVLMTTNQPISVATMYSTTIFTNTELSSSETAVVTPLPTLKISSDTISLSNAISVLTDTTEVSLSKFSYSLNETTALASDIPTSTFQQTPHTTTMANSALLTNSISETYRVSYERTSNVANQTESSTEVSPTTTDLYAFTSESTTIEPITKEVTNSMTSVDNSTTYTTQSTSEISDNQTTAVSSLKTLVLSSENLSTLSQLQTSTLTDSRISTNDNTVISSHTAISQSTDISESAAVSFEDTTNLSSSNSTVTLNSSTEYSNTSVDLTETSTVMPTIS